MINCDSINWTLVFGEFVYDTRKRRRDVAILHQSSVIKIYSTSEKGGQRKSEIPESLLTVGDDLENQMPHNPPIGMLFEFKILIFSIEDAWAM